MSVIINDFEVVLEPPERPTESDAEIETDRRKTFTLSPQDVAAVLERQDERRARVQAY